MTPAGDRRVLVWRNDLLAPSETFIRDQARFLQRWHAILVGQRRVADGLDLGDLEVVTLARDGFADVLRRVRLRTQRPHGPTIRALERLRPRLAHVHFGTDAVDAWPNVQVLDLPMLVTLHGYDITTRPEWWLGGHGGRARKRYPRQLLQLAEQPRVGFIAVSDAIRADAIARGIPAQRIVRCHIGIDTQAFRPQTPRPVPSPRVLFVGRLVEKKGVATLLHAFAHVRASLPDATLAILGDGPLRASLAALAHELAVPVEFLGQRDSDAVRGELERARVFCLPSVTAANGDAEGFGMVLLEAQAMGVPVVSSARGGAREGLREGQTGFAFPEGDSGALASLLVRLLRDDAEWARMAQAGPAFVRSEFDIRPRTAALEALYDRVASAGYFPSEPNP